MDPLNGWVSPGYREEPTVASSKLRNELNPALDLKSLAQHAKSFGHS
jgi:hypothetical protein